MHRSPLGHGESNRRCTLQVETRDVDAGKRLTLLLLHLFAAAVIPGFNPAARSTGIYVSHGTTRGQEK